MIWDALPFCPVNELLSDVRTTAEQIEESVRKAVESHGCDSKVNDNLLPSLNNNSKIEKCERDFEENDGKDVEKREEDGTL